MSRLDRLRFALEVHTQDPIGAGRSTEIRTRFEELLERFDIPAAPPGWEPARYLEAVDRSARAELQPLSLAAANEAAVHREINTCQRSADQKGCDPSLGEPRGTPPREMPPSPPVVTPPREMPPDGPQPFRRHADGRPYVNDDLISRYVAASQAKVREGGAYWRQGRMGQADYAEISGRFQEYFRYENGPEIDQRFDDVEVEAITRRRAEVNKAYYENW